MGGPGIFYTNRDNKNEAYDHDVDNHNLTNIILENETGK